MHIKQPACKRSSLDMLSMHAHLHQILQLVHVMSTVVFSNTPQARATPAHIMRDRMYSRRP